MTGIFQTILNMSITGAYIAAAIILLRLCMKKLPRRYSYLLWSILGIRLLCPFSFSSVISVFNLLKPQSFENQMTYIPQDMAYSVVSEVNVNNAAVNDAVSVNPKVTLLFIAAGIWLAGIAAMLIYSVIAYFSVRRRVALASILQDNIYLCGGIETPFVYGIIKPRIYIPTSVSGTDLEYILAHEKMHIRRGDHIIKLTALLALTIHWFNPLAWISYKLMVMDMELSCDERAVSQFDSDVRKDYATALLNISIKQNNLSYGGLLSFGESNVKSRIKGILAAKKPTVIVSAIAVLAIIMAAVCLLTNAVEKKEKDLLNKIITDDYGSYMLVRSNAEKKCTPEEVNALIEKICNTKAERLELSEDTLPSTSSDVLKMYKSTNCDGDYTGITIESKAMENGESIYWFEILSTNSYHSYKISENDWSEINNLFSSFLGGNINAAATIVSETEPVVINKVYTDELVLCSDYLSDLITSLYKNNGFNASNYISDSDMLTYARMKQEYEKGITSGSILYEIKVHADKAVRADKAGGIVCLKVPYEVSYRYGASTDDSGYGTIAYFEVKNTDDGWKIYRVCDCGTADTYAMGIDAKDIDGKFPVEIDIPSAISKLSGNGISDTGNIVLNAVYKSPANSLQLSVQNLTDNDFETGYAFTLERLEDGKYVPVEVPKSEIAVAFPAISVWVEAGETWSEEAFTLDKMFIMSDGNYRITRNGRINGKGDMIPLTAYFEVGGYSSESEQ